MAQVYLSQYARRAGIADSASHVIGGVSTPAPLDTYIQYNRNGKFGAEVHFRYIYPIHSFQHGNSTNALGDWSHTEGATTYTGFPNAYSSSILSGAVTLSAEYGNITSSFRTGDFIYLNDYYSDNILGTTVAKINSTSWDDTSSYVVLDVNNIHVTTSFVGSLGTYYIQNSLGNKTAGAYIAHAEGKGTYAMGIGAHSEGSGSYAIGKYSHTEGNNTVALGDYQTIVGQYNLFSTSQSAFIIGDGYARIIDSGTFGNSPTSGSSSFYINSTYSPPSSLTGSIITIVSASSSVSELFIIDNINDLGGGEYEVIVNRGITQNYYEDIDTFSIMKVTRHNLLFASQSYFQVSASNVYLQGINKDPQQNVITYDPVTGQVYYTSSNALSAVSTPLDIYDDDTFVISSPTSITFTGSGVSASDNGAGVDVYIPEGPNFATADLVFTGNRKHSTNNYSYFLYSDLVGGNDTPFDGFGVSGSYHYLNSSSNVLGTAAGSTNTYTYIEITTQSIDLSFNADPIVPSTYKFTNTIASFSSSLNVTKSVYFPGLTSASYPNVVVIDTSSGQLYYSTASVGGAAVLINNLLTNITVGGSDSGTLYTAGTLLEAILRDILIDYFDPTLNINTLRLGGTITYPADTGTYVEVSRSISFNTASFSSQADNPGGRFPYSASFTSSGATNGSDFSFYFGNDVVTANNNLGVGNRTIIRNETGSIVFTLRGTHPSSSALPNIVDFATLTYVYPIYYGMTTIDYSTAPGNLESAFLAGELEKSVVANESTQNITLNDAEKFIYFAYPNNWGLLSSIVDTDTDFEYLGASPAFTNYTMSNQSGSTAPWGNQIYRVYQYDRNYPNGTTVNNTIYRFTFA